jgi:hypothetical protein
VGSAQRSGMQCVTGLGRGAPTCRHPKLVPVSGAGLLLGQGGVPGCHHRHHLERGQDGGVVKFHGTEPPRSDMEAMIEA